MSSPFLNQSLEALFRRFRVSAPRLGLVTTLLISGVLSPLHAQSPAQAIPPAPSTSAPPAPTASAAPAVDRSSSGDSPANPGPLATDISPRLSHDAIAHAAARVADWQLSHSEAKFNEQWTFAALYDGLLAASQLTHDPRYRDSVLQFAQHSDWKLLDNRFPHADDEALGQAYLDLYLLQAPPHRDPIRIADTKRILDRLIVRPDDPQKLLWWWCDALFMAPPVLARMSLITGDRRYLDFMDHEWWLTSASLYSPSQHLFFRDSRYFTRREQNGSPIFWSRGNGWVMAAFAKILEVTPTDYPSRPKYIAQYREMAAQIAAIQGPDGLWRSGLLDPAAYALPEISGSSFFTYSIAWGINHGILDRARYQPVVERAWPAILSHIYADGRLGSIQPIDGQPGIFPPSASYVYGVGGFLLAASEMDVLARSHPSGGNPLPASYPR